MRKNKEIALLLNNRRKELDMSISELARNVGMAKSTLSRYFNLEREFPIGKIDLFANSLDLDIRHVLGLRTDSYDIYDIYVELEDDDKKKVYDLATDLLNKRGD